MGAEQRRMAMSDSGELSQQMYVNDVQKEKVLMVGAGGIGCELLKTLVLTGFKHIHLVSYPVCSRQLSSLLYIFKTCY